MSEKVRRVILSVTIAGHDVAGAFAPYLLDFSYKDNIGGKSDEVQLSLHNRDGRFSGEWALKKGLPVTATIVCRDWEGPGQSLSLPCGAFKIDEIEFSGPPDKISIKAVSADLTGPLRDTRKTRAWENTSLSGVAGQIAGENDLALFYAGPDHPFQRQDQRNESDISFLNRIALDRGCHCKVHNGKLAIFDAESAESAGPYYALAAHPDISAVSVYSPEPGKVDIRPVLKGGELSPPDVLEDVLSAVNADNVRPLTDIVLVRAPELIHFDINLAWYLDHGNVAMLSTISGRVHQAVEEYRLWQRTQPGRDILPIRLASLLERAGVKRVEMRAPVYRKLEGWQLARERQISVIFGGL